MTDRFVRLTPVPGNLDDLSFYKTGHIKVPLDTLLEGLGASIDKNPGHGPIYGPFREWLRSQSGEVIDIPPEHRVIAFWWVMDLIKKGIGTVYCRKCREEVRPEMKKWGWVAGPGMGEGGKDFFCGHGHTLIHLQTWVS